MNPLLEQPSCPVLRHFAVQTRDLTWHRAPRGFSGAEVWRGEEHATARIALKVWPTATTPDRLRQIHAWMARANHLSFVPRVFPGVGGQSVCVEGDRVWDCCAWQPGQPRATPTAAEVEAACEAVAQLHLAWSSSTERGPCPGVSNRLRILAENEPLLLAGPDHLPPVSPQLDPLLRSAVTIAGRAAPIAVALLRPWAQREFPLQPCVRDLRADHVLFEQGQVAGIIDFGAMAVDHPAVDLARLLGDYGDGGTSSIQEGLTAYRRVQHQVDVRDEFVRMLAQTGALCSLLGWLGRLVVQREPVSDPAAILLRVSQLIARVEQFPNVFR